MTEQYPTQPDKRSSEIASTSDFGWWWHLANKAVEQEVEVDDE